MWDLFLFVVFFFSNLVLAEKFYVQGDETKVALVKEQQLELDIYLGNAADYESWPKFNLTIGGVNMTVQCKPSPRGRTLLFQINDHTVIGPVNTSKIWVNSTDFAVYKEIPVKANHKFDKFMNYEDLYTISVGFTGDFPGGFMLTSSTAEIVQESSTCGSSAIVTSLWLIFGIAIHQLINK